MSVETRLVAIEQRLSAIEARLDGPGPLTEERAALLGQRLPHFWGDIEVRRAVLARHRQMTVRQALSEIRAEFGEARLPSKSAIYRVWQRLDREKRRAA